MDDNDDGKTVYYDREGNVQIRSQKDGSVRGRAGTAGFEFIGGKDGAVSIRLDVISSIGIKNILKLRSYNLVYENEVVTHEFEFLNGRKGTISYNTSGHVERFSVGGVLEISYEDGVIMISDDD